MFMLLIWFTMKATKDLVQWLHPNEQWREVHVTYVHAQKTTKASFHQTTNTIMRCLYGRRSCTSWTAIVTNHDEHKTCNASCTSWTAIVTNHDEHKTCNASFKCITHHKEKYHNHWQLLWDYVQPHSEPNMTQTDSTLHMAALNPHNDGVVGPWYMLNFCSSFSPQKIWTC